MSTVSEKLEILTDAAKYDVSCSSSGSARANKAGGLGNSAISGICHSWSADGRCISLLKILMTNHCIYDCDYCINRRSNDVKRAMFSVDEIVDLTMNFYKRNYIEGLFLSSGVFKNCDYTMELLIDIARRLREVENFNGYIHMKAIPGASKELIDKLGIYVDRVSVNIELPTERSLQIYAPEKKYIDIITPMSRIKEKIIENSDERKIFRRAPKFVQAGQTTQMIIGAGDETDFSIIKKSEDLYTSMDLKRVYYSAFMPVPTTKLLKNVEKAPLKREHRIYQADFLMRFYYFKADDILSNSNPFFDDNLDPKANWAVNNMGLFPMEVNRASYQDLLKIPGVGPTSAKRIVNARKLNRLVYDDLKKIGVVLKRAQHFITVNGEFRGVFYDDDSRVREILTYNERRNAKQISFWISNFMIYIYDGSFEGLLTAFFYGYSNLNRLEDIRTEEIQLNLLDENVKITTELDKAERIIEYVKTEFGYEFFRSIYYVFLSNVRGKELISLKTIFLGRRLGREIVSSTMEPIVEFMKIRNAVGRERHAYTGLLRFSELEDDLLYAKFQPEHDILPIVFGHFKNRLGNRKFMIHDIGRKQMAYFDGELKILKDVEFELDTSIDEYSELWKVFYNAVAIENRKNEKLKISNLPKKYWQYLTEMN